MRFDVRQPMKKPLILIALACLMLSGVATGEMTERGRVEILLSIYVQNEADGSATVAVSHNPNEHGYYVAYWLEKKKLLTVPKDFGDKAIGAPELVVRQIQFPDDVRKQGDPDLATSTYLVTEDWFRDRVFAVLTAGWLLKIKGAEQE